MAVQQESYKTYQIPENFVDDSRIIKGMFRTKNFIEAVIMVLIALIPAMLIPVQTISQRITAVILICGPFFVFGVVGINGDTLFTFFKNMKTWRGNRSLMLYNTTPRALKKAPLEAMMEAETAKDKLVDMYEKFRNSQATRDKKTLIEGVNFEFKEDPTLKKLYMDEKDLQEKKEVVQPESPDVVEYIYDLAQQIDQEKLIDMINEMDGEEGQSTEDDIPILMFEEVDFEDL